MNTNKWLSVCFLAGVTLLVTGCLPQSPSEPQASRTAATPVMAVDVAKAPMAEEVAVVEENFDTPEMPIDILPEDMRAPDLGAVVESINGFRFNQNSSYTQCLQNSVQNCEYETVYQVVQTDKDVNACDALTEEFQIENCKNQLWQQLAQLELKVDLCDNIQEEFANQNCLNEYWLTFAQNETQPEACENIADQALAKQCENQAYLAKAIETKDKTWCEQIKLYSFTYPELEIVDGEEPSTVIPEPVLVEVTDEENYDRQFCESQIDMFIKAEALSLAVPADDIINTETNPEVIEPNNGEELKRFQQQQEALLKDS